MPTTLFAALIALPGIAFAADYQPAVNQGNITPASAAAMAAPNTLQQEIQGPSGELLATQPGEVDSQDNADIDDDSTDIDSDERDDAEVDSADVNNIDANNAEVDNTDVNEIDSDSEDGDEQMAEPTVSANAPTQLNQQHSAPDYDPLIQGEANRGNVTPADLRNQSAPITLQEKKKGPRGELLATQPGEVQLQENRRFNVR